MKNKKNIILNLFLLLPQFINTSYIFVKEALKKYPITYIKIKDDLMINVIPFPLSREKDSFCLLAEEYIMIIPNGKAISDRGIIQVGNDIIIDSVNNQKIHHIVTQHTLNKEPRKIDGRVAVIATIGTNCYYHWIIDAMSRISMLHEQNIAYDYLYVPNHQPYMKLLLSIYNIDAHKIISPEEFNYIQADELIVTSLARSSKIKNHYLKTPIVRDQDNINYLKSKILPIIKKYSANFSKKIFISRQDSTRRRIINEDEIFTYLEQKGFKRYCLSQLSVVEQAALFYNAEIIVGAHGGGFTNIIFCKPKTQIIEIFQDRLGQEYFYLSKLLNLDYQCLNTSKSTTQYGGFNDTFIPIETIKNVVK